MTASGTMARRPEDSENWGGQRPNSGRKPLWNMPKGTGSEPLKLPKPIKDVLVEVRDSGVKLEEIVKALKALLQK